ncbi:MAG TPA: alanine--glyoxylate aminotransferase family protein [Chthoniobacterales bacterium]|nr:alanine--glyoxylate aminotransferase family protein [Chthoniobacterales bacterium]
MTPHIKLFIPGPVEVSEKTRAAFARPLIGHRSSDFKKLYAACQPRLQELFGTRRPVYISTSSAWGVMEGVLRNLVDGQEGKVLNCMNGAFSDKWFDVTECCGYRAEALQVAWGNPITPKLLKRRLEKGGINVVTLVHSETSTGVLSPLSDLAVVMKQFPEIFFVVDTVSSFSTMPIPMDELGIDVMITGCQKGLALPPGMALFSASQKALARAAEVKGRGYYFDFLEFEKNHEGNMTLSTPVISHIYALESKLDDIFTEGVANRYTRHAQTNKLVHDWVQEQGFDFFAPEGYRSLALTCVKNNRAVDIEAWIARLKEKYFCIFDPGYGKLKFNTFRISNMGDETEESISQLITWLDDTLE